MFATILKHARRGLVAALTLAAVVSPAALAPAARAADTGMSFIGASRTSADDIDYAADELAGVSGDAQFAFLPFEFNPDQPFSKATRLVRSALPRVSGTLRVAVYVKWFPHEGSYVTAQNNFWSAWNASRPTSEQQDIRDRFMSRVRRTNTWIQDMREWAAGRGLQDHLRFTIVPVLEDTCSTSKQQAYANLLSAVRAAQRDAGMDTTRFRRSCLPNFIFRPDGASLELHGKWSQVSGSLQSGDTWCNDGTHYDGTANSDGTTYSIDQFIRDRNAARNRGVHVIYWDGSYNGSPRETDNWSSRTVNPFTGSNRTTERRTLDRVLGR